MQKVVRLKSRSWKFRLYNAQIRFGQQWFSLEDNPYINAFAKGEVLNVIAKAQLDQSGKVEKLYIVELANGENTQQVADPAGKENETKESKEADSRTNETENSEA